MGRLARAQPESGGPPSADARVATLAAHQHGIVSGRQLAAVGLTKDAIATRVARGSLHRLYPSVFAVGHTALSPHGQWLAAVGACGPAAALGYRDAGALHGFRQNARRPIDVVAPRSRTGHRGIDLHRVRSLDPADVTVVDGIRVTTVARTLVDLATVLPPDGLEKAVHEADVRRLLDVGAVQAAIARAPGRRTSLLAKLVATPDVSKEHLVRLFLRIIDRVGLPRPATNTLVHGYEADCYWPDLRLVVELDGAATHLTRKRFQSDRRRDVDLLRAGITTVRFTHTDLSVDARRTEAAMRDLVGRFARPQAD